MLGKFPSAKQKYFYGSGLWNPTYYLESVGKNRFYQKLHKEAKILLWTSNKTKWFFLITCHRSVTGGSWHWQIFFLIWSENSMVFWKNNWSIRPRINISLRIARQSRFFENERFWNWRFNSKKIPQTSDSHICYHDLIN